MKKTIKVLFVFFLMINYSCKEKIDFEKEKEAILAVLEEESASYYASDFERWSATQSQDSSAIRISASKTGYGFTTGWQSISSNMKTTIVNKREVVKEIKTPIQIKIYEETAWVVFNNDYYDNNNKYTSTQMKSVFLEKHDGKWKEVLEERINAGTYTQADNFLINSINYAKSLGKSVEDFANFTADQYKTSWNTANGYNGIVSNWRSGVAKREFNILEQDENHVVFSANNMFRALKNASQNNVTYDDYLVFYRVDFENIADYLGFIYEQETTTDGVKVTITKK